MPHTMTLGIGDHGAGPGTRIDRRRGVGRGRLAVATLALLLLTACQNSVSASSGPSGGASLTISATADDAMPEQDMTGDLSAADRSAAMLAGGMFQDVEVAQRSGYASSLLTLGCFQDPARGGMGVHYINSALMDDKVDAKKPEALVYELDHQKRIAGLVAYEYIVPIDAWHSSTPPKLFGVNFHKHPTLPLWVLHAWLWKANPRGVFADWNPAVRLCPTGVPIFGQKQGPAATTSGRPGQASSSTDRSAG